MLINMKISMINDIHEKNRFCPFHDNQSCMTSRRRHFVFFTLSHINDHIFLTKYQFQNSFGRHKLQVHIYGQNACRTSCASRRARTRASKFKNAQNSTLIKREYISDNFEHFKNFRACASVRAFCARAARTDSRNSVSLADFDS